MDIEIDNLLLNYLFIAVMAVLYLGVPVLLLYLLIRKFINGKAPQIPNQEPKGSQENPELENIPVRVGNKIHLIPEDEIIYFDSENNSVHLHSYNGKKYLFDQTLDELIKKLPSHYLRIHRSIIVNQKRIQEIRKFSNGKYSLMMDDIPKSNLESSRSNASKIKKLYQL